MGLKQSDFNNSGYWLLPKKSQWPSLNPASVLCAFLNFSSLNCNTFVITWKTSQGMLDEICVSSSVGVYSGVTQYRGIYCMHTYIFTQTVGPHAFFWHPDQMSELLQLLFLFMYEAIKKNLYYKLITLSLWLKPTTLRLTLAESICNPILSIITLRSQP